MPPAVSPIPAGYPNVTPYLSVRGAAKAIAWYAKVLGAKEHLRLPGANDTVSHAELRVGDSMIMLADENTMPDAITAPPAANAKPPVAFFVYVERVDEVVRRALAEGASELRPLATQFYGDRTATVRDPWGHVWTVATHVEDVPPDEMQRRIAAQRPA